MILRTLRAFLPAPLACATLVLALGMLPAAHAQAPAPGKPDQLHTFTHDELEVVKVLTRQEGAWNRGDLDSFATGYKNSPETLFVGHSISRGYDQMLNEYKHNYPSRDIMGTLSFTELEPHLLDEKYAVVLGHYKLERSKKAGGNAEGIFSLVLEKTKDGWKIIVDHTTG